jgi:hypothetical protein
MSVCMYIRMYVHKYVGVGLYACLV